MSLTGVSGVRPGAEGGEIDEQLERRAGLAARLDGAVERASRIIPAADHRDDPAVEPHGDQSRLGAAESGAADGANGEALQIALERGLDEALAVALVAELGRLGQHPVGEIGAGRDVVVAGRGGPAPGAYRLPLLLGDVADLGHGAQDEAGAVARAASRLLVGASRLGALTTAASIAAWDRSAPRAATLK